MFRRICLFLFLIGLALPAATMPAMSAPKAAAAAMPGCHQAQPLDRQQDHQQAPFQHQCIGCVAIWQVIPCPPEREVLIGMVPAPLPVKALTPARAGPEVPPPRT